jgi:hypothetical protein
MLKKAYTERHIVLLLIIGFVLSIGGYIFSEVAPGKYNIDGKIRSKCNKCQDQYEKLKHQKDMVVEKQEILKYRLGSLKEIYSNPKSEIAISLSWASIEELQSSIKNIANKLADYEHLLEFIENKSNNNEKASGFWMLIPILLFGLLILYLSHILLRHGITAVLTNKDEKRDITKTYWISVSLVFLIYLIRTIYTSILIPDKIVFSSTSFCISPIGWASKNISYFGGLMICLYPFSLLMFFSSSRFEKIIPLKNPHFNYGVGEYILFLHTWTIITCIGTFFLSIISLTIMSKNVTGVLTAPYLVELIVTLLLGLIIIKRLIHRAVSIRIQYNRFVSTKSWKNICQMDFPPDPTNDFLGEKWFVLPASLTGILVGLWVFVKLSAIDMFILNFIK